MTLASVRDLVIGPAGGGAPVVDGVSLTVAPGQVLGLVGRSGSGKTAVAHALLGHLRPGLRLRGGEVRVDGLDPFGSERVRGRVVSYLGQDPAAALNPARRIGAQLAEAIRLRTGAAKSTVDSEVARLLGAVDLPADRAFLRRFSHQISGGQAQRVGLAIAVSGAPRLLVLDEPTSGLDTVVAAGVRALLGTLLTDLGAVLVSHDRHLVAELADDVIELSAGKIVPGRAPTIRSVPAPSVPGPPRLIVESLTARHGRRNVVDDASLRIPAGTTLALVGPSGSGKTTIARAIVGLHEPVAGRIELAGEPLAAHFRGRTTAQRRAIQLVAQDSVGALNPRETVRAALLRPLSTRDATAELPDLLDRVHLPAACADRLPGQLSGGERQRVNLCRALAASPQVLVCDEITSALDGETAAAVLTLLSELRRDLGLAVLLVTHDLAVAAVAAHRIAVLDHGRIVESGPTAQVLSTPTHPLTQALVDCRAA